MPSSSRRPYAPRLPPEERREQLLDAALTFIAERGFLQLSMEAVAREAGVTRPVVYGAFGDLGTLLNELLARSEARALAELADVVPELPFDGDPDDVLVESIRRLLEIVQREPELWRLILFPAEGTPDVLRSRVASTRAAVLGQLERLVAWAIDRRGGPHGVDVELLARTILVLGEESARLALTDPERFSAERLAGFAGALARAVQRAPRERRDGPTPL